MNRYQTEMDHYKKEEEQMELFNHNRLDELEAYAQTHSLARTVILALIAKLKQSSDQTGQSIH